MPDFTSIPPASFSVLRLHHPSTLFHTSLHPSSFILHPFLPMFDPTKPATNSPLASAEMRSQLTSLNADIQQRATGTDLANGIAGTSSNSNGVATLGQGANGGYDPGQMQAVLDKLDELINALRR